MSASLFTNEGCWVEDRADTRLFVAGACVALVGLVIVLLTMQTTLPAEAHTNPNCWWDWGFNEEVCGSHPTHTPTPEPTDTPKPTATNTPKPTATNTPKPTATNTPKPTATNTPRPTATNTPRPTATPTPEPSGRLHATRTTIDVGQTTKVTAYDRDPPDLTIRFSYPGGYFTTESSCPGGSSSVARVTTPDTIESITLRGCSPGTAIVRLLRSHDGSELDSIQIDIEDVPTPTPTPEPSGSLRASRTTIEVGETTVVTAFDIIPEDLNFRFSYTSHLKNASSCSGRVPTIPEETPITLIGCTDGTATVWLRAVSGNRLLDSISITVNPTPTPTPTNSRPVVDDQIPAQTLTVGGGSAQIDLSSKFSDPDSGDTLTYEADSSDTGVVTESVSGSILTLSPAAAGSTSVTVTATDEGGLDVEQSFTVTVSPPDSPPTPPTPTPTPTPQSCSNSAAVSSPGSDPGLVADCEILMGAKETLEGTASLDWSYDRAITSWEGVTVSGTPSRVTVLDLDSEDPAIKDLDGSIPSGLGGLSELTFLRFRGNRLTGGIPSELGNLTKLTNLVLRWNRLTGAIPSSLVNLLDLEYLVLDGNQLTGGIPSGLGNLSNLKWLQLGNNQLTGGIPSTLGSLSDLENLNLFGNQLTGGVPSELGDLSNLTRLGLSGNSLTGCIPAALGDVASNDLDSMTLSYCPAPPTLEADVSDPFTGQSVTITASASALDGAAPSYQWQEWSSSGQWTDLGASSASAAKSVSSSSAGVRTFRVRAVYGSTVTTESAPITIEWRPITVAITVSDPNPESGEESESSVTLTAVADAPSGVTYQWQRWLNGGWVDRESSTSATKVVWFTSRGTRKYRVVVSHATASSAESLPAYVTWDEWAIVSDLVTALQSAVSGDADYTDAQTDLLTCMNGGSGGSSRSSRGSGTRERGTGNATSTATSTAPVGRSVTPIPSPTPTPTYASFDDILSRYTGDTKAKMDAGGACHTDAEAMFDKVESLSKSKLAALKTGSTEYAALLETPHGQQFEANVGADYIIKQFAYLMASDTTEEPGELEAPLYQTASGATRTSRSPTPPTIPALGTGFSCLPTGVDGTRLTLRNKLVVLNCLVFSTPHSFWVDNANQLKADTRYNTWLGYGDWVCTDPAPDGPVPSCKKHDVAYDSLQMFAGKAPKNEQGNELDEAWNPRNKALADSKFHADILRYGCQDPSWIASNTFCRASNKWLADRYHWGVAHVNHKGWPVTKEDILHTESLPRFVRCGDVPKMIIGDNGFSHQTGWTFRVDWQLQQGCVEDITIHEYQLCISVEFDGVPGRSLPYCLSRTLPGSARSADLTLDSFVGFDVRGATYFLDAFLRPSNINYGGIQYKQSNTLRLDQ